MFLAVNKWKLNGGFFLSRIASPHSFATYKERSINQRFFSEDPVSSSLHCQRKREKRKFVTCPVLIQLQEQHLKLAELKPNTGNGKHWIQNSKVDLNSQLSRVYRLWAKFWIYNVQFNSDSARSTLLQSAGSDEFSSGSKVNPNISWLKKCWMQSRMTFKIGLPTINC